MYLYTTRDDDQDDLDHGRFIALNEDGQLFEWSSIHEDRLRPILINGKVVQVAVTETLTLALTDQGELFSWPLRDDLILPKRIVLGIDTSEVMCEDTLSCTYCTFDGQAQDRLIKSN